MLARCLRPSHHNARHAFSRIPVLRDLTVRYLNSSAALPGGALPLPKMARRLESCIFACIFHELAYCHHLPPGPPFSIHNNRHSRIPPPPPGFSHFLQGKNILWPNPRRAAQLTLLAVVAQLAFIVYIISLNSFLNAFPTYFEKFIEVVKVSTRSKFSRRIQEAACGSVGHEMANAVFRSLPSFPCSQVFTFGSSADLV